MAMHEIAKQEPFRLEFLRYWNDYYELCKPRVVALIIFTASEQWQHITQRFHDGNALPKKDGDRPDSSAAIKKKAKKK